MATLSLCTGWMRTSKPAWLSVCAALADCRPTTSGTVTLLGLEQEVGADARADERQRQQQPQQPAQVAPVGLLDAGGPYGGIGPGARRHVRERAGRRAGRAPPPSAAMNSSALAKRQAGSLAIACSTTSSSAGDTAGLSCGRRDRLLGDLLERDRHRRVAVERHPAGQALVEQDAGRVEVRARRHRVALRLLGRQVLRGAEDRAGLGHVRGAGAGDAEVRDLGVALVVDDHVVRLDVAVDDPALVGEALGAQDLDRRCRSPGPGRAAPRSRMICLSERPSRNSIAM